MDNSWTEKWTNRWNERFSGDAFAYGEEPNLYLNEQLVKLNPGKILFAAEGEGRNAVFAAKLGWTVSAFDISEEGRKKALKLAENNQVTMDYQIGELEKLNYACEQYDVIALIYAHFPADLKSFYHTTLSKYLRKGGYIIFEAFSKKHVDYIARNEKVGGLKDVNMLFSMEELTSDFSNFEIISMEEKVIDLKEGAYHDGTGSVVRFVGRKK